MNNAPKKKPPLIVAVIGFLIIIAGAILSDTTNYDHTAAAVVFTGFMIAMVGPMIIYTLS